MTETDRLKAYLRELVEGTGFEGHAFLVGGCVRDRLLDKPVKDVDIVVDLLNGGIDLAEYLGAQINREPVIYQQFGTAMLNFIGREYMGAEFGPKADVEFVQTRKEIYTRGSRKPQTSFGTLEDDAHRRDFTINALYEDLMTGEVVDPTGKGLSDLQSMTLRTTSTPEEIFSEDPLRMLRAARFYVKYHTKLAPDLVAGIKASAGEIKTISAERVRDEISKILELPDADKGIEFLSKTGLLRHTVPELEDLRGLWANPKYHHEDAYDHTLSVLRNAPPGLLHRLAALFHDIGKAEAAEYLADKDYTHFDNHPAAGEKIVRNVLTRLKYPNDVVDQVADVVANHMFSIGQEPTQKAVARLLNRLKVDIQILTDIMEADRLKSKPGRDDDEAKHLDMFKRHVEDIKAREGSVKSKPPVTGDDIMEKFGLKPGRGPQGHADALEVGRLVKLAMENYLEDPTATKEVILDFLATAR